MKPPTLLWSLLLAALASGAALDAQEPTEKILAGWPGVFPEAVPYIRHFEKPKSDQQTWRQSARYEWSGGRLETIRVTLLFDAAEAKKHQFGAKNPPPDQVKKLRFGERLGWEYPAGRLVIDLGNDRMMILEAPTWKFHQSDLPEFAKRFPLEACAKALAKPPRTDFRRRLDAFRDLKKDMSLAQVREWVGDADKDIGSGIHILEYRLDDGARVLIGFPDFKRLIYVKHEDKAGKVTDLVK